MNKPLFEVDVNPGSGNLSARAYYASIIGPRRVALGSRRKFVLEAGKPTQLVSNTGTGKGVCFVSVSLVPGTVATLILFGSDNSPSDNNGTPETLSTGGPVVGSPPGGFAAVKFQAILNPGDMLFASLPSTAAAGTTVGVVVSTEWY